MKNIKKNVITLFLALFVVLIISGCRDIKCIKHFDNNKDGYCDSCDLLMSSISKKIECHNCHAENESDSEYCSKCGKNLFQKKECPQCGNIESFNKDYCSSCGTQLIIKCIHSYNDPSCETPTVCTKCDQVISNELNHVYDNDCDRDCNRCGETRVTEHKWLNATCYLPKTCSVCGLTEGSKLVHLYDNDCDEYCNRCGESSNHTHSYQGATCYSPIKCTKCGDTIGDALGHLYTNNCDTSCNRCGATRSVTHSWISATYENPKTCSVCGKTEGSKLTCTSHIDSNRDNYCDKCGAKSEYKAKWQANQQTGGWNGHGMTVKIFVSDVNEYDPFVSGYNKLDKKILQKHIRDIERAYGIDLVYENWPAAAPWGPNRIEYIKQGRYDENLYIISIGSAWIETLVRAGCLAELAQLNNEYNAISGIFTEIGYQETFEGSGEYVEGTYLQDINNNKMLSVDNKVFGYVKDEARPDYFMYYNADLIADAGMTDPAELWLRGEWTWSNFENYCTELQAKLGQDKYALSVGFAEFIIGSTASTGNKIATTRPSLGLTSLAVIERFEAVQRLYASGCYENRAYEDVSTGFLNQSVAFVHGNLWFMGDESRFSPYYCDFVIGAVPYPTADYDGGQPITTANEDEAIRDYYNQPIELVEGSGEYISGVDMSNSSFAIPLTSTSESFSIIDTSNGKNGINNKILFAILYDLYSGLGQDPEQEEVDEDTLYRKWLLTKFDRSLYADVIMSVQDNVYFELIENVSMIVGSGSQIQGFWGLAAKICKNSSIDPYISLMEVLSDYKYAMKTYGYDIL